MRFYIQSPPTGTGNSEEQLRLLTSWLYSLTETLNVTLNCLGTENFNEQTRALIRGDSERTENVDIQD